MQDTELRGSLLQKLYDMRRERDYFPEQKDFNGVFPDSEILRIAEQLNEHGLVQTQINEYLGGERSMLYCRISALGIDTVESGSSPNLRINLVPQQNITISGSSNVVVGNNNQLTINHSVQELVRVIESSTATSEQKTEAKNLLRQFLAHPLLTALAGGAIGLL